MTMVRYIFIFLFCFASLTGCRKSAGGDDTGTLQSEFFSDCGTVINGSTRNPVKAENGTEVIVTSVIGPNAVAVARGSGTQIIKLRSLRNSITSSQEAAARDVLQNLLGPAVLFTDNCTSNVGGGQGIVGQLYRNNGVSFSERLLKRGAAQVLSSGDCGEAQLAGCYNALLDQGGSATPTPTPTSSNVVSNFLWEPESALDGALAIYLNPANATVIVNNDTFVNTGPSNGRGTTARTNKSGCAFGNNVLVEVFDGGGSRILFPGGQNSYVIPNGCETVEF